LFVTAKASRSRLIFIFLVARATDLPTERRDPFLLDYTAEGKAIGIEFTSLRGINIAAVNHVLTELHEASLSPADLAPLTAA
jgi:hypothetical protein